MRKYLQNILFYACPSGHFFIKKGEKYERKFSTRVLAEVAIFAALAFALDALQGGILEAYLLVEAL